MGQNRGCTFPGCEQPYHSNGYCNKHASRLRAHGDAATVLVAHKPIREIHKRSHSAEWAIWRAMIQRCTDARVKAFKYYGGRGITICDRWRQSFRCFLEDVGARPIGRERLTLDRIDNNGNYEPGNVRWASWLQQGRNRRQGGGRPRKDGTRKAAHP